jgi:hypothetical protein
MTESGCIEAAKSMGMIYVSAGAWDDVSPGCSFWFSSKKNQHKVHFNLRQHPRCELPTQYTHYTCKDTILCQSMPQWAAELNSKLDVVIANLGNEA